MLVLQRKLWQRVCIQTGDGPVWVQVVDIERGKIRLGITAPAAVQIVREELLPDAPPASK